MPITAISSIWYPIEDWHRAKEFYSYVLGLRLEACDDQAGWAVYKVNADGPPFFLVRKPGPMNHKGGGVVSFDVTDAAAILEKVAAFGVPVDPRIQEGGTVRIYTIFDPDGNAIELSEKLAP